MTSNDQTATAMRDIADLLWEARKNGTTVPAPKMTVDEKTGYAIQDAMIAQRPEALAGWKVGATNKNSPPQLGLSQSLAGPIWAEHLYSCKGATATVSLPVAHRAQVEVEVAFRIGPDVASFDPTEINNAVDGVTLALEFTGNRFDPLPDPPGPGFAADHGGNGAVVLSRFIPLEDMGDLADLTATLDIDGVAEGQGVGRDVMEGPLNSLTWLAGHLATRGHTLQPGQIVITGAVVPLTTFKHGAKLSGNAAGFDAVSAIVSAAR